MNDHQVDQDLQEGAIRLKSGQSISIIMPRPHWEALRELTGSVGFVDVASDIAELIEDPRRTNETDSQLVMWYIEMAVAALADE